VEHSVRRSQTRVASAAMEAPVLEDVHLEDTVCLSRLDDTATFSVKKRDVAKRRNSLYFPTSVARAFSR
jgi:hypothetical protein